MELNLNPELEARLQRWAAETGRSADELVEAALADYLNELQQTREMLDSRYDELKSGSARLIDGEEARQRVMDSIEANRRRSA